MPLAKRYPWFSQPPVGTPIDWSNSLTRGLVFANFGTQVKDGVSKAGATFDGSAPGIGRTGAGRVYSGAAGVRTRFPSPVSGGDLTLICVCEPTTPANTVVFGIFNPNVTACSAYLEFGSTTINAVWTDAANWVVATGPAFSANSRYVLAATFKAGGGCQLFVNGLLAASDATARTLYGLTDISLGAYEYYSSGTLYSNFFKGLISRCEVFNRVLSKVEIAALSESWQVYQP